MNDTSSTVYSTGDLQKILLFPVGNFNDDDSYIGGTEVWLLWQLHDKLLEGTLVGRYKKGYSVLHFS